MDGWVNWKNLNSVSGCFPGLYSLPELSSQGVSTRSHVSWLSHARKHSKKMTLTRALPANGLSALQAGELVSGIKTGLHGTELLTRALGREGESCSLHLPFPTLARPHRGSISPMGSGRSLSMHPAQATCVFRGSWPWRASDPCLLLGCENTEEGDTKCKKKKKKI